jgi:benzoate membrane transport protein
MTAPRRLSPADASWSAIAAGALVVLVSYSGPLLIYHQAAMAMGVSSEIFSSWVMAISVAAGLSGIGLSLWLRAPIIAAWSAPGTALLLSMGAGVPMPEVVGAFLIAAAALLAIGLSGMFDRFVRLIPEGVASGMMAGILLRFGVGAFGTLETAPVLCALALAAFAALRLWAPRYAGIAMLPIGIALSAGLQGLDLSGMELALAQPELVSPVFTGGAALSLAAPLLIVTLTGQFLPGMAILRASGYHVSARPIMAVTGVASLIAALFGGITTALSAITAALCTTADAHPDPARRYVAGLAVGGFYLIGGVFSGTVVALLGALPPELVAILAGFALIGAIGASLRGMVGALGGMDAGLVTFLITVSGVTVLGVGAAFWGVVAGALVHRLALLAGRR